MRFPRDDREAPTIVVRKAIWLLFLGAIVVALAIPIATTVRQSTIRLEVKVSTWPAHPRVGQTVYFTVSMVQVSDRATAGGPWAQLVASWDMAAMQMGIHQTTAQGTGGDTGQFTVPLQLGMAGSWWIQATLRTPGRPTWHGSAGILVSPAVPPTGAASGATSTGLSLACRGSGGYGT